MELGSIVLYRGKYFLYSIYHRAGLSSGYSLDGFATFEPQAGLPEAAAELNRLKELRIIQRINVMQIAEQWVSKRNVMRQEYL